VFCVVLQDKWENNRICSACFTQHLSHLLQGGYAGNAAGVKLSSLQKLTDIRANKPGMNLIHYVALVNVGTSEVLIAY
jgi:hypothetical protein